MNSAAPVMNEVAILKEICIVNGINYDKLATEATQLRSLEMFFSGMPRMVQLHYFTELQELSLFGQTIEAIENLDCCLGLKRLWVCECELKEIGGLQYCKQLRQLFLYSNQISRIQNLEHLELLEKLWLNDNKIRVVEGLDTLTNLDELNLSGNLIDRIGNGLDRLHSLETLFLSGNRLWSLKDLINLTRASKLKTLGLKDPQYRTNPLCTLSNYSTFVLYHLYNLSRLDSFDVSSKQVKEIAENVVMKKKMFYFMKTRSIKRTAAALINKLKHSKDEMLRVPHDRMKRLSRCLKDLQYHLHRISILPESNSGGDSSTNVSADEKETVELKIKKIKDRYGEWQNRCQLVERLFREAVEHIYGLSEGMGHFQNLELTSGGNVKFEEGSSSHAWFKLCGELLASRFCVQEYRSAAVVGIRVNRVFRVHNTLLQANYDDAVNDALDKLSASSYLEIDRLSKKYQEYLLWCPDPASPGAAQELYRILEEGFQPPSYYAELAQNEGVPLTNSLNIAEQKRIDKLMEESSGEDECPFRVGRALVVKVFVGKSMQEIDQGPVRRQEYPELTGGYRPKRRPKRSPESPCECTSRQMEWLVFNHKLVLPEYIIDFEYLTQDPAHSPFYQVIYSDSPLTSRSIQKCSLFDAETGDDDAILELPPSVSPRRSAGEVSEANLPSLIPQKAFINITHLNLHAVGLTKLGPLSSLTTLTSLILSFNEITNCENINQPGLEILDLSFNRLSSLDTVCSLTRLKRLDVSWNRLHNTRDDVSLLHKQTPNLTHLRVEHNPWLKADSLRLRIIGRLKYLVKLDSQAIGEAEAAAALRMAAGSRISQVLLLTHSRTDNLRPRSLCLQPAAQMLHQMSRFRLDRSVEEPNWFLKITSLCLDGQHISKISNLDKLECLRYASFNNNDITRIDGLEGCANLEELSLEDNCIGKIENIARLPKLKRLFLAGNSIHSLVSSGVEMLHTLQTLGLENNRITSLRGVERCVSLLEIYLANNKISDNRDIFYLKNLSNLIILDLFGNSLTHLSENYRLNIVYHLKTLKALDGQPVEPSEISLSRELLGGKLTCDFLIEKQGHDRFYEIRELDFPNQGIRSVELTPAERFINLRSVNLEHNQLTSFSGLIHLTNLRVLCLNHNHVETLLPKPPSHAHNQQSPAMARSGGLDPTIDPKQNVSLLDNLEVLHLGHNAIRDLAGLQLHRLPSLKALFLQGNEITTIEGLEGLQDLRELVLDRNKIKSIPETAFINNWNLHELHLEENRLRDLTGLFALENLHRLFLGSNRIQEFTELDRLDTLRRLVEISLVNNLVARRAMHRPLLIHKISRLQVIDGVDITEEERERAEMYFNDQTQPSIQQSMPSGGDVVLPGIPPYKSSVPVKVTNMNLGPAGISGSSSSGGGSDGPGNASNGGAGQSGAATWYEAAVNSASNNNNVGGGSIVGASRLRGAMRLAPAPVQPPIQSRPMYYYDPSGHVEPTSRWGYNKRK